MGEPAEAIVDDLGVEPQSEVTLDKVPRPPRRARALTLAVMAFTMVAAGFLAWQLRSEAMYALNAEAATEVGVLAEPQLSAAHDNTFARARVVLKDKPLVRFRRPVDGDEYHVAQVQGASAEHRWVAYRVPTALAGPRFVPPSLVAGRLVRVRDLGARYRGLRKALERASGAQEAGSWVLVDGQDPRGAGWQLGLLLLLLALVGWNGVAAIRILRRVPAAESSS